MVSRAIDSVLSQSYQNIECIVVDDFSSDGTVDFLREQYNDQILLFQNLQNQDKSYSRNRGIKHSNGELICFLDSDDELPPNSIQDRILFYIDKQPFIGVIFGFRKNENESLEKAISKVRLKAGDQLSLEQYIENPLILSTNSFLLSKNSMLKHGMYNESFGNKEDVELFLRLLVNLPFIYCGKQSTIVHADASNRTRDNNIAILNQGTKFSDTISSNSELVNALGKNMKKIVSNEYEEILRALYYTNQGKKFRQQYARGIKGKKINHSTKFLKRYIISFLKINSSF